MTGPMGRALRSAGQAPTERSRDFKGSAIRLEGQSLDTGVVADFLRVLNASPYFVNVDLDKTSGGDVIEGVRLVNFVIRADMTAPVEETGQTS